MLAVYSSPPPVRPAHCGKLYVGPVLLLPFVHSVACVHSEEWGYSLRRITWAGGTFQSASFSEGQGWVVTFVTRVTCVWRGYARQCKKSPYGIVTSSLRDALGPPTLRLRYSNGRRPRVELVWPTQAALILSAPPRSCGRALRRLGLGLALFDAMQDRFRKLRRDPSFVDQPIHLWL